MEGNESRSPYHGVWLTVLLLVFVPFALTWLIEETLAIYQPHMTYLNDPAARFVGYGLGTLFHLICILGGLLRESGRVVADRIREFFANLVASPGFAIKCYWHDMRTNGVVFDIYMLIILSCAGYAIHNLLIALTRLHII